MGPFTKAPALTSSLGPPNHAEESRKMLKGGNCQEQLDVSEQISGVIGLIFFSKPGQTVDF